MDFSVRTIKDKKVWEDFLFNCQEKTFLQSWNWGNFQEKMGHKIWRLGIYNREKLVSPALVSKISAKRGAFFLIQHGPNIKNSKLQIPNSKQIQNHKYQILNTLLEKLKRIGKEEKVDFIRANPLWENNQRNQEIFKKLGFKEAPIHANAYEATLKLNLSASEQELLGKMRKTSRYLIRRAIKNQDITIEKSEKLEDIEKYQNLNKEIAKRQNFVPFSSKHIKNEFEVFWEDNQSLLFLGKYKKELVAAALIIFWSGIGFYHQAASSSKYANFSIPYLILWEAIKEAKKRGCFLFDFWGFVDPKKQPNHPWSGPTLFKMGFGGQPYEYLKAQDLPLSKKYWLIYAFEKVRSIKRGLGR